MKTLSRIVLMVFLKFIFNFFLSFFLLFLFIFPSAMASNWPQAQADKASLDPSEIELEIGRASADGVNAKGGKVVRDVVVVVVERRKQWWVRWRAVRREREKK